jgi:hypothetical protein
MGYVFGFLPWVAFFVITAGNHPDRQTLLIGAAVGLGTSILMLIPAVRRRLVTSLDIGGLVFFPLFAGLTFVVSSEFLDQAAAAISQGALTLSVGAGILVGRPFTMVYAKANTPEPIWDYPNFVRGNARLTYGWVIAFALMTISSIIGAFFDPSSVEAVIFNWVIPIAIMVVTVRWQIGQIKAMRAQGDAARTERINRVIQPGQCPVAFADHVTATLPDAASVRRIAGALHSAGLIAAWPIQDESDFATAGIRLGNLNLELCHDSSGGIPFATWLTFEPYSLKELVAELDRRSLAHDRFDNVRAGDMDIYTRVGLPDLAGDDFEMQLCETFATTRTFHPDAPPNRLGVARVRRIRVNVDDEHWPAVVRLMAPADLDADVAFSEGPPVRFTRSSDYGIDAIELIVTDVATATKRFADAGATARDGAVYLGGIRIELHT